MAKRWYAMRTRDVTHLMFEGMLIERTIVHEAGQVWWFRTKCDRDAFVAAGNAADADAYSADVPAELMANADQGD
jgi:hypothetical protein